MHCFVTYDYDCKSLRVFSSHQSHCMCVSCQFKEALKLHVEKAVTSLKQIEVQRVLNTAAGWHTLVLIKTFVKTQGLRQFI